MRCDSFQRFRGIVVEVRRRVPDAAQLGNLECVDIRDQVRAIREVAKDELLPTALPRDQSASRIWGCDVKLERRSLIEDEFRENDAGVVLNLEIGNTDTDEPLSFGNRQLNEILSEFISLIQQRPAVTV